LHRRVERVKTREPATEKNNAREDEHDNPAMDKKRACMAD